MADLRDKIIETNGMNGGKLKILRALSNKILSIINK